ncbi:DUF2249 domain-containing protein [Calidifontibacillus oryziterrae]|uniref:DUF2249 domain-containing protein n=1 Tax=Calidifontibacillus oryziterrae TaxID=1191699 RepID=UPI0002F34E4B|nr:DUF2249 domain-containing protein [Calidifontibacillus oryziterrae]
MTKEAGKVIELDVREDIAGKLDPFQKIMNAIGPLESGDILILHAPFKPTPLLGVLGSKGFSSEAEEIDEEHWKVTFVKN